MTPVGHGASRIEACRLGERARRFRVIEAIRQVQALIDEQLSPGGLRRHRKLVDPEVLEPWGERHTGRLFLEAGRALVVHVAWRRGRLGAGRTRKEQSCRHRERGGNASVVSHGGPSVVDFRK